MTETDLDPDPLSAEEIEDIIEAREADDFESMTLEQILAELDQSYLEVLQTVPPIVLKNKPD